MFKSGTVSAVNIRNVSQTLFFDGETTTSHSMLSSPHFNPLFIMYLKGQMFEHTKNDRTIWSLFQKPRGLKFKENNEKVQ